jgi:hypothetical protein
MIHELRVLHCVPGRLPALLKRFETDTLRLFEKHGIKQLGFWTVAIGESNNDLFLILQWESLAERERKFGAFLKDPEWLEARRKSEEDGPVEATITNTILVPTAFSLGPLELKSAVDAAMYEDLMAAYMVFTRHSTRNPKELET